MSCVAFDFKHLSAYVNEITEAFPKVKYNYEWHHMSGHIMRVTWSYQDYEVVEHITDADIIFDYQQLLIEAGLI